MADKTRFSLNMPIELFEAVREESFRSRIKMTEFILDAIREKLNRLLTKSKKGG